MNTVDWGLVSLFILGIFFGYRKGFVKQAVGLMGLILSFFIAYSFSKDTAVFLQHQFPLPTDSTNPLFQIFLGLSSLHQWIYTALAFILLFFITRLLCRVMGKALQMFAELPVISFLNRWLGALLGFSLTFVVLLFAVHIVEAIPESTLKEQMYNSTIASFLIELSPKMSEQIRDFRDFPNQKNEHRDILSHPLSPYFTSDELG